MPTGLRSIPNCKENRKRAACTNRSSLNKFTLSLETQVPWKTTFVTFSVLGIVYQALKAFTLTAGAFLAERGSVSMEENSVFSCCLGVCSVTSL